MASNNLYITWVDYVILGCFLGLSGIIGVWHGCFGKKQKTTKDFLVGGGKMGMLPTALSLFASLCSATTLLGIPVEIYYYSTLYLYFAASWLLASFFTTHVFIPKYRKLGYISVYSYLERRFSLPLRICVTLTYVISNILVMSVLLYGPCLTLSQVTGIDLWLAIISCGVICTFYTSIGGMKAVIWTDVAQSFVIFFGVVLSIIFGFVNAGGVSKVFETAYNHGRIKSIDVSFDPTIRYTLWSTIIGGTFYVTSCSCVLQTQVQRYMCVSSTREAQKATWVNNIICVILMLLCGVVGLLIYDKYHDCDPLRSGRVSKPDQFYPLFVIETFSELPGLTGLFIAAVLSGSLSSVSSGVNSIAAVIMEDVWKPLTPNKPMSDERQTKISKYMSGILGLLIILFAFLGYFLKSILVIAYSIMGALPSPIFGVFILGFFFPRVNSRSALIAFLVSIAFQVWVIIGANLTFRQQPDRRLPTSISECMSSNSTNITFRLTNNALKTEQNFFLPLYSISFLWYAFNGVMLTVIIGLLCSLLWKNDRVDPSLLISSRQTFCCFRSKFKISQSSKDEYGNSETYQDVEHEAIERTEMIRLHPFKI